MTTVLIGSTGPLGRAVCAAAAGAGLDLVPMARRPEALAGVPGADRARAGDVRDPDSLRTALEGATTVISALGSALTRKPVDLLSVGTRNVLDAMAAVGATRLLCVTGVGAGDSRGHGGFVYDKLALPLLLRTVYADKDRQEALLRASDVDWVIVRPGWLTNDPAVGQYQVLTDLTGRRLGKISRAEVADYLVTETLTPSRHRETVNLTR